MATETKKQFFFLLLITWLTATAQTYAQTSDVEHLFRDLENMEAGSPAAFARADPILERLVQSSNDTVKSALPLILHAASNPHLAVRRVVAMALYEIATRPDNEALLSRETATFAALLIDTDLPIRRITILSIYTLHAFHPDATSELVPVLEAFLARGDAVSTVGETVAPVLLGMTPDRIKTITAIATYMRRKDQTSQTKDSLLNSIQLVIAEFHYHEIGAEIAKEIAAYGDDPDDQTSVHAIQTLVLVGKSAITDNQQALFRIKADTSRASSVRATATKALSIIQ